MRLRPEAVLAIVGWAMVCSGLWAGISLSAALVVGGGLLLAAVVTRTKA